LDQTLTTLINSKNTLEIFSSLIYSQAATISYSSTKCG
jgi:hypothetical protein